MQALFVFLQEKALSEVMEQVLLFAMAINRKSSA
jgi:hypothetical protein